MNDAVIGAPASARIPAVPRVLSIAGTDPTGGAGIQADLKSIAAAGGYGMSAVTALVAQNTQGVREVHTPPVEFLRAQLTAVASDVTIDAVKIGMLGSAAIVAEVSRFLAQLSDVPVVLDPVMVATSGDRLLDRDAEAAVRELCARATVVTPNLKELAVLTQTAEATTLEEAIAHATAWSADTRTTVIVKGGHLRGDLADNAVVTPDGAVHRVSCPRVDTPHTHGTGCSLSSALATRLGAGASLSDALSWSTRWLHEAISHAAALEVGQGHGPVDHGHRARRLAAAASTVPARFYSDVTSTAAAPAPHVSAAGPETARLWELTGDAWQSITQLPFIQALGTGTLREEDFAFYLAQDAQYLNQYSKALARLAALAPDAGAQLHWASGAAECLAVEMSLHKDWIAHHTTTVPSTALTAPSRVTSAYTDFLVATTHTDDYVVAAAAVLPCYWLYAEVGLHLAAQNSPEHPYNAWITQYGGEEFLTGVRAAIALVEEALTAADPATRSRATRAYLAACWHEVDFFDQADRRW